MKITPCPCPAHRGIARITLLAVLALFGLLIIPRPARGQTPSVPSGLTATVASPTQINLAWGTSTESGGTGVAGYNVYRGNSIFVVQIGTTTTPRYTDSGLSTGVQYCYAVEAYDSAGNVSGLSPEACATPAAQGNCTYGLSATAALIQSGGGSRSVGVTAASGCNWTAASADSWVTITSGSSGSGDGTVSYTVAANSGTAVRSGTITIAGQSYTVTQPGIPCSYSISPGSASMGAGGGSGTVAVSAASGCAWTASSNVGWITVTAGSSGSGNGTVSFSVAANTSASELTGTITIAGETFTVSEAGAACSYSLSPSGESFGSTGGSGSVTVTATGGCGWTASSGAGWITITGGGSGVGNGTVTYSVLSNSFLCPQTGTLTIAGQTYTVSLAAPPDTTPPHVLLTAPANGSTVSGSIAVTASAGDNLCGSGMAEVEFYRDSGVLIGVATSSPYSMVVDTTTIGNGTHLFYAQAYDRAGNSAVSAAASVTVNNAGAVTPAGLHLAGFLPEVGTARDVALAGTTAYVAGDVWGLTVVDVSVPQSPRVLASASAPFFGDYVAVAGGISCVSGYRSYYSSPGVSATINGFYMISNATASVIGSNESATTVYNAVAMTNGQLFVACGTAGLEIFNISNPSAPTLIGSYNTPGYAFGVQVAGNYAYVADGASGLEIVNISNPSSPTLAGALNTPGAARDVAVAGGVAYVADENSLQVINVSNPSSPTVLGSLSVGYPGSIVKVKLQKSTLYAASSAGGLLVIDVSAPSSPALVATLAPTGPAGASTIGVAVAGSYAYLANYLGGLATVNISTPAAPSMTNGLLDWFAGYKIAATPNLAVITGIHFTEDGSASSNALRIVNTQSPSGPEVLSELDNYATPFNGVAVAGAYAYVACGKSGVSVVNLSNPSSPTIVGTVATPGYAWGVTVAGSYAYVANGSGGLSVLSLSNPAAPVSVGTISSSGTVKDVAVINGLAYLAAGNALQIVDVSNPSSPAARGSLALSYPVTAVAVKVLNNVAYVAGSSGGLITIDVSNPSSPQQLGVVAPGGESGSTSLGLAVTGTVAYVANGVGGLGVVDVSNPAAPVLQTTVMTMGELHDVCLEPNWLYGADDLATLDTIYLGQ